MVLHVIEGRQNRGDRLAVERMKSLRRRERLPHRRLGEPDDEAVDVSVFKGPLPLMPRA
jgi:hypothetical protein